MSTSVIKIERLDSIIEDFFKPYQISIEWGDDSLMSEIDYASIGEIVSNFAYIWVEDKLIQLGFKKLILQKKKAEIIRHLTRLIPQLTTTLTFLTAPEAKYLIIYVYKCQEYSYACSNQTAPR